MPIEIKDVNGGLGCILLAIGVVEKKEYIDAMRKHLTQDTEKFKRYRYNLADWTAVTAGDIPSESIQLVAELCKKAAAVNPNIIVGSVAGQDLSFGLVRMAHIRRDGADWESKAFRNRVEAEAWIEQRVKEKYDIDNLTFG